MERVRGDAAFRDALLAEAVDALLAGELDVGKAIIRDVVEATVGSARKRARRKRTQR
jgi:hypothetical protein